MKEKELQALIRKIQKQCGTNLVKRQSKPLDKKQLMENNSASELFSEMKKLPFSG